MATHNLQMTTYKASQTQLYCHIGPDLKLHDFSFRACQVHLLQMLFWMFNVYFVKDILYVVSHNDLFFECKALLTLELKQYQAIMYSKNSMEAHIATSELVWQLIYKNK